MSADAFRHTAALLQRAFAFEAVQAVATPADKRLVGESLAVLVSAADPGSQVGYIRDFSVIVLFVVHLLPPFFYCTENKKADSISTLKVVIKSAL